MKVEITKNVRNRMLSHLQKAGNLEIGGVLMAEQLNPGEFRIVDFSIDPSSGGAAHFVRSPEHLSTALNSFFEQTSHDYHKYNYLGEWHSHPNHLPVPSPVDINSMYELLREEKNIPFAILLVVKKGFFKRFQCSAMYFQLGKRPESVNLSIV